MWLEHYKIDQPLNTEKWKREKRRRNGYEQMRNADISCSEDSESFYTLNWYRHTGGLLLLWGHPEGWMKCINTIIYHRVSKAMSVEGLRYSEMQRHEKIQETGKGRRGGSKGTDCMELSVSLESNGCWATQDISKIYRNLKCITSLKTARHWSLSWAKFSTHPHPIFF